MARGRKTGGRKRGTPNRRTIAQQEIVASGMSPLDFLCAVYRDPKQSMTRRIEAAKCAAPYIHPRISTTDFVCQPQLGEPELEAAATGPNTPQQLDVDRPQEDRKLLTR
jgi:hypothetical protein